MSREIVSLPPYWLPAIMGIGLIVTALKFLDLTFDSPKWVGVGIFGGFIPFVTGLYLVLGSVFTWYLPWFLRP